MSGDLRCTSVDLRFPLVILDFALPSMKGSVQESEEPVEGNKASMIVPLRVYF